LAEKEKWKSFEPINLTSKAATETTGFHVSPETLKKNHEMGEKNVFLVFLFLFFFTLNSFTTYLKDIKALKKLKPYSLAGFDLTSHNSSLLGGRRSRYH
jgi:hypothetical protein